MVMMAAGAVVVRVTWLIALVVVIVIVVMLVLMFLLRCHLFVIRSKVGLRLGNVLEQFGQHAR